MYFYTLNVKISKNGGKVYEKRKMYFNTNYGDFNHVNYTVIGSFGGGNFGQRNIHD